MQERQGAVPSLVPAILSLRMAKKGGAVFSDAHVFRGSSELFDVDHPVSRLLRQAVKSHCI